MNQELKTYTRPDSMQDIADADLVQLSRKLLDGVIVSTDAMTAMPMSPERAADLRLVLGFLKATNNMINSKLHYFHLVRIDDKIAAVKSKASTVEATPQ